jgi:nucleotide-binding universal stress UspA family protein
MYRHILVATDGSTFSARAIRTAIILAKSLRAKLTCLHVIAAYAPESERRAFASLPGYARALRKERERAVARVRREARSRGVEAELISTVGGDPWRAILATARKRKCDLLVMASHGRGGIAGLLLGSETRKVLTHTSLPVLVCR